MHPFQVIIDKKKKKKKITKNSGTFTIDSSIIIIIMMLVPVRLSHKVYYGMNERVRFINGQCMTWYYYTKIDRAYIIIFVCAVVCFIGFSFSFCCCFFSLFENESKSERLYHFLWNGRCDCAIATDAYVGDFFREDLHHTIIDKHTLCSRSGQVKTILFKNSDPSSLMMTTHQVWWHCIVAKSHLTDCWTQREIIWTHKERERY